MTDAELQSLIAEFARLTLQRMAATAPETITTAEGLKSLDVGTTVRDFHGVLFERRVTGFFYIHNGTDLPYEAIALPARIVSAPTAPLPEGEKDPAILTTIQDLANLQVGTVIRDVDGMSYQKQRTHLWMRAGTTFGRNSGEIPLPVRVLS